MITLTTLSSGQKIYIEKVDPASAGTVDLPIIYIHGLLGSAETYRPLYLTFPARTCIYFDFQGHNRTPIHSPDIPLTPASLAKDVNEILILYGYKAADIVAHSGGCIIALQFAADFPSKARRVALLGPPSIPVPGDAMRNNAAMLRTGGIEPMIGGLAAWLGKKAQSDPQIVSLLKKEALSQDANQVASVVEALAGYEFKELGSGVDCMIVFGTEDPISTKEMCQKLIFSVHAKVVEIESGHQMTFENPNDTGNALKEFLG